MGNIRGLFYIKIDEKEICGPHGIIWNTRYTNGHTSLSNGLQVGYNKVSTTLIVSNIKYLIY